MSIVDSRPPISCCMIVRDEEANIVRCLESVRPFVRQIVVIDTGSVDATQKLCLPYVDHFEVFTACNDPETGLIADFAMARQRSLEKATEEWAIWIDGDDVLLGGEHLVELCKRKQGPATILALPYDYDPSCQQYRERLFSPPKSFHWQGRVHECIALDEPGAYADIDDRVRVVHNRAGKANRDPGRNLRILEKIYSEDGEKDARNVFYLGRELSFTDQKDRAITLLSRYVEISGWDEERSLACMRLSELHIQRAPREARDIEQSIFWGLRAISMTEDWGEPYFAVARAYSERGYQTGAVRDWQRCVHYALTGLGKPPTKTVLFVNPVERAVDIHRYLNVALNRIGDVQAALKSVKAALEAAPGDPNLDFNRKIYSNHIARERLENALGIMVETGKLTMHMAATALACVDGRAESYVVGTPEAARTAAGPAVGAAPGDHVTQIGPYRRPAGYPRGVTEGDFPRAAVAPHAQAWLVPDKAILDDLPLRMTDGQLTAMTLAIWKEYVLHDEMLSAISFLENAPYRVRHSVGVGKALSWTRATMAWMDDPEDEQKTNAPEDVTVECGVPLPGPLSGQLLGRSELVTARLGPPGSEWILDFGSSDGSITNRWGLADYDVVGVDLCRTSVALAKRKAEEFKTGVRFVCSKFSELEDSDEWNDLELNEKTPDSWGYDVVTSTDTYEHVKDGVADIIAPARLALGDNPKGRMILVTPYGAWMRGAYLPWAHPWRWADEKGMAWCGPEKRAHLIAPTPWTVAADFRRDGWWVKDSFAVMCDVQDTPGQGNVVCEAYRLPPWHRDRGGYDEDRDEEILARSLDVVFSTGDAWQEWNPEIMKKDGIGGSETAVVEMAKRLARRGHRVRVYGSCGAHGEGIYDGVEYRTADKIVLEESVDVLVAWRNIPLLAGPRAKVKLLWVHDVYAMGPPGCDGLLLEADRVLALSEWHKQNICAHHGLSPEHVRVTRNGIDLKRFEQDDHDDGCMHTNDPSYGRPWKCSPGCPMARDPHKCIYSSSPDRGLDSLIQMWPRIRAAVPDATLHIFYGFDLWKACAANDPHLKLYIPNLETRIAALADQGVVVRGRVDQKTLAREMLSAGLWTYPQWFSETSCIGAMEAQAAGLYIVTSPIAAMKETAGDTAVFIEGDWLSADYQERFSKAVIHHMNLPQATSDGARRAIQEGALARFSWDGVAAEWEKMFYVEIERKKTQPLAPYSPARTFVREGRTTT